MSERHTDGVVELAPAIEQVTVYGDRARVTRRATVALVPGIHRFQVTGLTAALDAGSLRARVAGDVEETRVVGLTARWDAQRTPPRAEEARLEDEVERREHLVEELRDRMDVTGAGGHLVESYRALAQDALGRHAAMGDEPPAKWSAALEFLAEREGAQARDTRATERELRELERELRACRAELAQLRAPRNREARTVEVVVQAGGIGPADLVLEYAVLHAQWSPAYDVRVDGATLELTAYGTVTQGTGEDWTDVQLVMSTARPGEGARIPELTPLLLSGHDRVRRPVTIRSYGTRRDAGDDESEEPWQQAQGVAPEPAGRAVAEQGETAVRFAVRGTESVPADRRPHRIELLRVPLDAEFSRETIPKVAPFVHLKATCRNTAGVPLLAGPVNVFRSSGFVGAGALKHVAPGQEFAVSLGTEEALKVRRIIDERIDREPRLLGSKRSLSHAFRVELTNRTGEPRTVTLVENIPVSQREEIQVELARDTLPDERDDDGFLRWNVALEPGERREIPFGFSVSYPKDWNLAGL